VERRLAPLRFGVYEIDLDAGELRKSGRKISLQEQPFRILALLLARPGQLVTREELQKRLWPADTFVDFDLGLNTAVKKIRSALGDSADNPRFVETLPKRGYRFICSVEESAAITEAPPDKSGAETAGAPSFAALHPASVHESQSAAKGGIFAEPQAIPNHGETLQPGEASRAGASRAGFSHRRFWPAAGVVAMIVLAIGLGFYLRQRAAHRRPTVEELERAGDRGTSNNSAYEFYKEGRRLLESDDAAERSEGAIHAFQQAIETDRNYSLAYSGLGEAYTKKYELTRQEQWRDEAQQTCNYAVELDAGRAEGRICLGVLDHSIGLYKQAVKDFSDAIQIDPQNGRAYRGRAKAYVREDRIVDAERDYLRAIQISPENWRGYSGLGQLYFYQGRYGEAASHYQMAVERKPDSSALHSSLGAAYLQMGLYDKAAKEFQAAIRLKPDFQGHENLGTSLLYAHHYAEAIQNFQMALAFDSQNHLAYGALARAYSCAGQQEPAQANYQRAIALAKEKLRMNPDDGEVSLMLGVYHGMMGQQKDAVAYLDSAQQSQPGGPEVAFWTGVVHFRLGDRAAALAWIRRARARGYSLAEINSAPELDSLRGDPEFRQILSTNGNTALLNPHSELNRRTQ